MAPKHKKITLFLYTSAFLLIAAFMGSLLRDEFVRWSNLDPAVVVERHDWKIIGDSAPCIGQISVKNCPANANFSDWQGAPSIDSDTPWRTKIKDGTKEVFWIRTVLTREQINIAIRKRATHFILGKIVGNATVWINGNESFFLSASDRTANILAIPYSQIDLTRSLVISIRVEPKIDSHNLLLFTEGWKEGLATKETAMAYRSFLDFIDKTKAFTLFFSYFILAAAFFLLWYINPIAKEYLALSALAIANALPEMIFGESFSYQIPLNYNNKIFLTLMILKSAAAIALGFSFSRTKFHWPVFFASLACMLSIPLFFDNASLKFYRLPSAQLLVSVAFLIGGFACLHQLRALLQIRKKGAGSVNHRIVKLSLFCGTSFALAIFTHMQFGSHISNLWQNILWGVPDFSYVAFLGILALLDYQQKSQQLERSPISEYHKRPNLPESISGILMVLDIKNSESFFRNSSGHPENEAIMPLVMAQLWRTLVKYEATILKAEGDEVIAFFDAQKIENPSSKALVACEHALAELNGFFRTKTKIDADIQFRVALTKGKIQPIWIGSDANRYPDWNQVGESMVFVEASRLLEIERGFERSQQCSYVVMGDGIVDEIGKDMANIHGRLHFSQRIFTAKHGHTYKASAFELLPQQPAFWLEKAA